MEESTLDTFHTCKLADRADGGVKAGAREIIRKLEGELGVMSATCFACGSQLRPKRSTARFCSPRCRVAAQRARDRGIPIGTAATRPSAAAEAVLSVTTPVSLSEGQKPQSVTLRRKPPKLDPRIAPDPKWPGMYRVRRPNGSLTDMVNLTRAKDALAEMRGAS